MRIPKVVSTVSSMIELRDVFVFGGLAVATYGVSQINVSAAWILCGAVLFALGLKR